MILDLTCFVWHNDYVSTDQRQVWSDYSLIICDNNLQSNPLFKDRAGEYVDLGNVESQV